MTNPNLCEMVESLRYLEFGFELAMCIDNVIFNTYHIQRHFLQKIVKCTLSPLTIAIACAKYLSSDAALTVKNLK